MKKENIIEAIRNPELIRRTFALLRSDPGPLIMVFEGIDSTWGYDAAYCVYFNGQRDFILAAEQGECDPGRATMISIGILAQWLNRTGHMTDGSRASSLAVVTDGTLDRYCAKGYPLVSEHVRSDGTCTRRTLPGSDGWLALVLGRGVETVEEVVLDMERCREGEETNAEKR